MRGWLPFGSNAGAWGRFLKAPTFNVGLAWGGGHGPLQLGWLAAVVVVRSEHTSALSAWDRSRGKRSEQAGQGKGFEAVSIA